MLLLRKVLVVVIVMMGFFVSVEGEEEKGFS